MARFTALPCSLQKLPSSGGECMFINMFTFCVSFHSIAIKLLLTLVFVTPLHFHFMSKILWHPFSIWTKNPQWQFIVLVCKLSDGDEKKLSVYNVCSTFSVFAISSVTVTWVDVMEGVTWFLLCLHTRSYCKYVTWNHKTCRVLSQTACVSLVYSVWRWVYLWRAQWFHQLLNVLSDCNI